MEGAALPQGQGGLGGSNLCKDFTPPPQAEPAKFRAVLSCNLACAPTESHKKRASFPLHFYKQEERKPSKKLA